MALGREPLGVARVSEHGRGEVRPADRLARSLARLDRRRVDREPERAQLVRHRLGATLPVGAGVLEALAQERAAVVDPVAEHMQVLVLPVHRRDLRGGHDPHTVNGTGGERLIDAVDGVVIGERKQLDPGRRGVLDDLGSRKRPIRMERMGLKIEAGGRHGGHHSSRGETRSVRYRQEGDDSPSCAPPHSTGIPCRIVFSVTIRGSTNCSR